MSHITRNSLTTFFLMTILLVTTSCGSKRSAINSNVGNGGGGLSGGGGFGTGSGTGSGTGIGTASGTGAGTGSGTGTGGVYIDTKLNGIGGIPAYAPQVAGVPELYPGNVGVINQVGEVIFVNEDMGVAATAHSSIGGVFNVVTAANGDQRLTSYSNRNDLAVAYLKAADPSLPSIERMNIFLGGHMAIKPDVPGSKAFFQARKHGVNGYHHCAVTAGIENVGGKPHARIITTYGNFSNGVDINGNPNIKLDKEISNFSGFVEFFAYNEWIVLFIDGIEVGRARDPNRNFLLTKNEAKYGYVGKSGSFGSTLILDLDLIDNLGPGGSGSVRRFLGL